MEYCDRVAFQQSFSSKLFSQDFGTADELSRFVLTF